MRLRGALFAASVTVALAIASPADAATCEFKGNALIVNLPGATDSVSLRQNGNVLYNGSTACTGGGTVFNVSDVFIRDTTPGKNGDDFVDIDLSGGPLAPGSGSEGVPEIEIFSFLEHGTNFVRVSGSGGPDNFRAGRTTDLNGNDTWGVNLNAGSEGNPSVADADLISQVANPPNPKADELLVIDGDFGPDTIDASGGLGFGAPLQPDVSLFGSAGNDRLTGGAGIDTLYADPGDDALDGGNNFDRVSYEQSPNAVNLDLGSAQPQDTGAYGKDQFTHVESLAGSHYDDVLTGSDGANVLAGGTGDDLLTGRGGDDGLDGGPGTDTASYRLPPQGGTKGVTVDLSKDVTQATVGAGFDTLAGVENLWGSPFADTLSGDPGANTIVGWQGGDSISGSEGDDELLARDGSADQITCGAGTDHVVADMQGTDSVFSDCESADFEPFVPPPPGTDPGTSPPPGGDPGTTPPPPALDAVAPVLDRLRLKPRSFATVARRVHGKRVARGTKVSYRLSESAAVTMRVQRSTKGRRRGGKCAPVTRATRHVGRACRRWRTLRGRLLHAGLPGANSLRLTGRFAGRRLARGSYRLRAAAVDGAGNRSIPRLTRFVVVR
jgi:Ca2+-binding RTX toxin-like protein